MKRRIFAFLLACLLLCGMGDAMFAAGETEPVSASDADSSEPQNTEQQELAQQNQEKTTASPEAGSEITVNPIYEEIVSEEQVRKNLDNSAAEASGDAASTASARSGDEPVSAQTLDGSGDSGDTPSDAPAEGTETKPSAPTRYSSEASAAVYVRTKMTARAETISFSVEQDSAINGSAIDGIIQTALEETTQSNQGDYLALCYKGYKKTYTCEKNGSSYITDITLAFDYYTTAKQETELSEELSSILASLNLSKKSTYQKICAIYDYVCKTVSYDSSNGTNKLTAYYALKNKKANCQGYVALTYRLMREAGVSCRIITGTTANEESHAWNIVKLGSYYYNIDATWDAQKQQAGDPYYYFLRGGTDFFSHVRNEKYRTSTFKSMYPTSDTMYVTKLYVNAASISLIPGTTTTLNAKGTPSSALSEVRWYSSNPDVVRVNSSGKITAGTPGVANIRAAVGSRTASCRVTVVKAVSGLLLGKTAIELNKGSKATLSVTTIPENNADQVSWKSANEKVATVSSGGEITAQGAGKTSITASANGCSASCTVEVFAPASGVSFPISTLWIQKGKVKTLKYKVKPTDCTDKATWSSSNIAIAKVSASGKITAQKAGTARISVKIGKYSASYVVRVSNKIVASDVFTDVEDTSWFSHAINDCCFRGLFSTSSSLFKPASNMNRAELMTVLYRAAGSPKVSNSIPFEDVKKGTYYYDAVRWGYKHGLIARASAFKPTGSVSRQQLVTFLFRYAKLDGRKTSARADLSKYSDQSSIASYARTAMKWAIAQQYLKGKSDGTLSPKSYATRADTSQVLTRYLND